MTLDELKDHAKQFAELAKRDADPVKHGEAKAEFIREAIEALGNKDVDLGADARGYMRLLQEHLPDDEAARKAFVEAAHQRLAIIEDQQQAEERAAEEAAKVAAFIDDKPKLPPFEVLTGKGWEVQPPPREWIVPDWIPANRVTLLTGMGEVGKSRLAVQLAIAMGAGYPDFLPGQGSKDYAKIASAEGLALGLGGKPASAVYATWEDERDELLRRLHPLAVDGGRDRFHALMCMGLGALWQPGGEEGGKHISVMGGITQLSLDARAYCERVGAKLLILDTLAAIYACNENDRGLVRAFMADLDQWAIEAGCAVLILAHPSKPKAGETAAAYSGSTDWHGAARSLITMTKRETPQSKKARQEDGDLAPEHGRVIKLEKSNYAWAGQEVWIGWGEHAMGKGLMVAMTPTNSAESLTMQQMRARRPIYK